MSSAGNPSPTAPWKPLSRMPFSITCTLPGGRRQTCRWRSLESVTDRICCPARRENQLLEIRDGQARRRVGELENEACSRRAKASRRRGRRWRGRPKISGLLPNWLPSCWIERDDIHERVRGVEMDVDDHAAILDCPLGDRSAERGAEAPRADHPTARRNLPTIAEVVLRVRESHEVLHRRHEDCAATGAVVEQNVP